jgi:cation diffusion facilitator family transporter
MGEILSGTEIMNREKKQVALTSVIAAIFLTAMKLVVGYTTGSLGIISEALHSGLDFVAAFITWIAVRVSSKPPDEKFNYGRGKVESFSALIETVLLLVTCIWIIHEAVDRLKGEGGEVEVTTAAFVVMVISIVIDYSRSSALYRIAKKYKSQALMADALHFSSDILSSAVVIVGLIFVKMGYPYGDPIAALGVALLVIFASYRLGMETINCLMDKAPEGLDEKIETAIMSSGNVDKITRLRVRAAGSEIFVDANIDISNSLSLERAHEIAAQAEENVKKAVEGAVDVVIHPDPTTVDGDPLNSKIIGIANKFKLIKETHNITFLKFDDGRLAAELHVTVTPELSLARAHAEITAFERQILSDISEISNVNTHIDVIAPDLLNCVEERKENSKYIKKISEIIDSMPGGKAKCLETNIRRIGKKLYASIRCVTAPDINMAHAHEISDEIEHLIHNQIKEIKYVLVHIEPNSDLMAATSS